MNRFFYAATALLLAAACGHRDNPRCGAPTAHQTAAARDTTNASGCQGTYTGVFPAADAPGIAVTLTLGPDGRYTEVQRFLERPDRFALDGRYTLAGTLLTLQPDAPKESPSYYRVDQNRLRRLDDQQQPITGPFADHYVLTRAEPGADSACH